MLGGLCNPFSLFFPFFPSFPFLEFFEPTIVQVYCFRGGQLFRVCGKKFFGGGWGLGVGGWGLGVGGWGLGVGGWGVGCGV